MKPIMTIFSFFLTLYVAQAQEEFQHPIDKKSRACYDKAVSTHDMIDCADKAHEAWDKELNKVYQSLLKSLNKDEQAQLRESQRAWITYRDNALKFNDTFMGNMDGTMWQPVSIERATDIISERTKLLQRYLDDKTSN